MILLYRLFPLLGALLVSGFFWMQLQWPTSFPIFAIGGILIAPVLSTLLAVKRIRWGDVTEKMTPTYLLHAALAFGLLLAEGTVPRTAILALSGLSTFLSLELVFLLAFHPSAYPVNGISRINIAYVPIAMWYALSTLAGLRIFLHISWEWTLVPTMLLGLALFRTTGHPGASRTQNNIWSLIGALAGLEIGWVSLHLPLSMGMQGLVATLLLTALLRVRRYLYDPKPSRRSAIVESVGLAAVMLACVGTANWL